MKVINEISKHLQDKKNVVLTIGFFDGLHLGHQKIFDRLKTLKAENGYSYALTFAAHPLTIIKPDSPFFMVCPLNMRLKLIENQKVDALILLDFTTKIMNMTANEFIEKLHDAFNFTHLVLGPDATIGRDKKGNFNQIKLLAKKYNFEFISIEARTLDDKTISSSLIRQKIESGDLELVSKMLGRKYSIASKVIPGTQKGRLMGFPTLNLSVSDLVLPPLGVYKVSVILEDGNQYRAIANLGYAPTLQDRKSPVLEAHLLDLEKDLDVNFAQVVFEKFIRPEKKFSCLEELKKQIYKDVKAAKSL